MLHCASVSNHTVNCHNVKLRVKEASFHLAAVAVDNSGRPVDILVRVPSCISVRLLYWNFYQSFRGIVLGPSGVESCGGSECYICPSGTVERSCLPIQAYKMGLLSIVCRGSYSTAFWLFITGSSFMLFPGALFVWGVTLFCDKRKRLLHLYTCLWASLYTWFNPLWDVTVKGVENMSSDEAYVCIANHLSTLDILIVHRLFRHFKWVSKIENFHVPFIGWNMELNKYIKV